MPLVQVRVIEGVFTDAQKRDDGLRSCCRFPPFGHAARLRHKMVEPIGIEPTTSSLQSSRSPN